MRKLFKENNSIFLFLSLLADLMILTIQWLVACIPIVTVGAATTALYSCAMKRYKEEVRLFRDFWEAFRKNFAQATILWIVVLALLFTVFADLYLVFFTEFSPGTVLKLLVLLLMFVVSMIVSYIFPLQAFFVNPVGKTLKNAFLLSVMYLPVSVVIVFINAIPVLAWMLFSNFFNRTLFLWVALSGGVIAYVNGKMLRRIFERHITKPAEDQ